MDVAAIRVDPAEFHAGRSAELDVHVTCHQKGGRDTVVWKGKATARANADSDGLLELGWTQHPFRVDWKSGDAYTIEILDRHFLGQESAVFALDLGDDGGFPLRSKTYPLKSRADGKPVRDPSANAIVLKSHRVDDGRSSAPAVAEGDHPRASTRRQ